ncbi:HNH endonuclease signature motif containing protein [Amycolatopsis cihanbeyliensis]|uniref:HNH endonuclease signature motif containing protein n=1 Tax=Amycolatopsis cihanbeyliensis TaxID=1128664 RepID=UPI0014775833|nr:HNH endonuclease signature motif containing protein [Amycolatopsis cihanbeyliensis]
MSRTFGIDTSRMGEEELLAALGEIEQRRRVDYAREVAVLAALDGRTTAGRRGYRDVTALGREIVARLDQDGNPPTEHDLVRPARFLDWRDTRGGRLRGTFELDAETAALVTGLIEPRAKPHSSPEEPDRRSKHQRQGDASADMLRAAARCPDDGPTESGEPVTVMVSITPDDLKHGTGHGLLHGQESHSATQIRRIACDAYVVPALLGSTGEILNIGQKHRTIPLAIRRALILRDNGCTFPGYRRKPKQCQAHHVIFRANGGPTALHNLTLLYPYHHNLIHHTEWHIRIRNGLPEFIPPTFLDPERKPRRNLLHRQGMGAA